MKPWDRSPTLHDGGVIVHAWCPSTQEVTGGRSGVQGHPRILSQLVTKCVSIDLPGEKGRIHYCNSLLDLLVQQHIESHTHTLITESEMFKQKSVSGSFSPFMS